MTFIHALAAITASGPMSSRAFLPLFLVCLLGASPEAAEDLTNAAITFPSYLEWLTSREALVVLGALALAECFAEKNPELQELLSTVSGTVKMAAAAIVSMAILPPDAASNPHVQQASIGTAMTMGGAVTATWYLNGLRNRFFLWLRDMDPDDSTGVRSFFSWLEEGWGAIGILILVFLPILSIIIGAVTLVVVWLVRSATRRIEERDTVPCPHCAESVMTIASHCGSCKQDIPLQKLANWGWLADSTQNEREHRVRLVAEHRCPKCATRIRPRSFLKEGCESCGFTFEPNDPWFDEYRDKIFSRASRLWVPITLISLVPGAGFAISLVAIKLSLVAPLSIFLHVGQKFSLRWGMRIAALLLLLLGCVPIFSMAAAPLLLMLHLRVYGNAAQKNVDPGLPAVAPAES